MFDELLQLVKDHMGNDPQVAAAIPSEQADAVHQEIATHLQQGLQTQASEQGGAGGLLSMLSGAIGSGSLATSAISGGLVGSLASKFGLSPAVTGAIAAAIPGLLQKFVNRGTEAQAAASEASAK